MNIINSLIKFYNSSSKAELKEKALAQLLRYFSYSNNNYNKRHQQDLKEEIRIVLSFFNNLLDNSPSTLEKNKILSSIRRYGKVEYREEFKDVIDILETKAVKSDAVYEELQRNLLNDDYFDVRKNIESRILKLINQYSSFNAFQNDLIEIRLKLANLTTNFQTVIIIIGKSFPQKAKEFFGIIQNQHPNLIPEAVFLISNQYKDEEYFYSVLEWLWARKDLYIERVFWLLGWGRNKDKSFYRASDLEYYEYAVTNNVTTVRDYIRMDLIDYVYLDKSRTFNLLDKHIKTTTLHEMDRLIFALFDEKEKYSENFKEELKDLFENNLEKVDLSDLNSDQLLRFIDDYFGFIQLLKFINLKIDYDLKENKYFHFERRIYKNPRLTNEENIERFIRLINEYILNPEPNQDKQDEIISLFRPSPILTKEIYKAILPLIEHYSLDKQKLLSLASALRTFAATTEEWINAMCKIANTYIENLENKLTNIGEIFDTSFYLNLGSKSKVGLGVGYDEDLAKKQLLEKVISENSYNTIVMGYLKKCLQKVITDIEETIKRDNEDTNW